MPLEVGRVCLKVAGREAGKYCVVLKKIDDNFVLVTGPKLLTGVRRRRCNVEHLEALPYVLEIKEDASDEEVIAAYEKANLISKFNLKKPSAAQLKAEKEKAEKKEVKEKEKIEEKEVKAKEEKKKGGKAKEVKEKKGETEKKKK